MAFAEGTVVPVAKTRGEIETLVGKHGASRFASGWTEDHRAAISFAIKGRMVRFTLTLPSDEEAKKLRRRGRLLTPAQREKWIDGESRRRWRSLLLRLKAKFEAVESGDVIFEEEFLAHIVTAKNLTVYEAIKLQESGVKLLGAAEAGGDRG